MDKNDFKINLSLNETNLNKKDNDSKKDTDENIINSIIENINENNIDTIFGMSILAHLAIDYLNSN